MSESKHTPGKCYVCDDLTIRIRAFNDSDQMGDYKGIIITDLKPALGTYDENEISICRPHALPETQANAERLAACWNACEGINPEAVQNLFDIVKRLSASWKMSAGGIQEILGREIGTEFYAWKETFDELAAAIAKAEGK